MNITPERASTLITSGEVVALPTETVYGLAADATNLKAVSRIFELKNRPADNPLIVHISDISQISTFTVRQKPHDIQKLANAFWPGPLTVVVPKKSTVLDIVTGGLDTVAMRMPDHPTTLKIIEDSCPVAAPSANRSGRPSPTKAEHVIEDFGDTLPIVDGGACRVGLESTVLDLSGKTPAILRPGAISANDIEQVLGKSIHMTTADVEQRRRSPGTRYSHYQPDASVRWMDPSNANHLPETFYIYHTSFPADRGTNVIHFKEDFDALARSLYDLYRTADRQGYTSIRIEPIPSNHSSALVPAILNRVERSIDQ